MPIVLSFGVGALLGAPYLPILSRDVEPSLKLAEIKPGEIILDLGCGDGKLLRAAARMGASGIGYEINPIMFVVAWLWCLPYRRHIHIYFGNYWHKPLPACDVVYVFLLARYMARLDTKITAEARRPLRLVSYIFEIPGRKAKGRLHNAFRYDYQPLPHVL